MFLLPAIAIGTLFALALGGRPGRLADVELRRSWTVAAALGLQIVLFSPAASLVPDRAESSIHLGSYALLAVFAFTNARTLALAPLFLGLGLNAVAIVSNGGLMPVAADAARAAGVDSGANVGVGRPALWFLGDVFALPRSVPLVNVFSVGDVLIAAGAAAFIVAVSVGTAESVLGSPARLFRPLRSRSYARLVAGKLVTDLGDWLTLAVLVGWIYTGTESVGQVAGLLLVRFAPPVLGGGVAALVVDRFPKERLLVAAELARGFAVAGALAAVIGDLRPLAFVALALSGAIAAVSSAAVPALVPGLVGDDELPAANAGLAIAQDAAMALGALSGGLALSALGAAPALAIDLGTFAVAASLYAGVRGRPAPAAVRSRAPSGEGLRGAVRYLAGRRALVLVISGFTAATLATGFVNATLPRFLDSEVGLGPGAYGYGVSALAWGLLAGEAFTGLVKVGPGGERWIGAALALGAAILGLLAVSEHAPTALLLLAALGFVDGTTDVLFDTVVQREVDSRYLGRVFALASMAMRTTMIGAVGAAPFLNRLVAPHDVVLVAAAVLGAAGLVALAAGRRRPFEPAPGTAVAGSPRAAA